MSEWLERLDYYAELYAAGERAQEHLRQTDLPPQTDLPQDHLPATVVDNVGVGEKEVVMGISDFEGMQTERGTAVVEQRSSVELGQNAKGEPVVKSVKVYTNDLENLDAAKDAAIRVFQDIVQAVGA